MQDCGAGVVTGATRDGVVPFHLAGSILVQGPEKSEDAVAGLNFESYRPAENETAGGKCSWLDGSRAETGRVETGSSADLKAARRAGAVGLSDFARYVERLLRGIGEGTAQVVSNIRDIDTGERSLVAHGTSAADFVCPVEGGVGEIPLERDDLPGHGRGGQRGPVCSYSTRQAYGG
jgi:hypothetical protein